VAVFSYRLFLASQYTLLILSSRCLEGVEHTVIVADPHDAPLYTQRRRRVKTDRRDAEALAHAWQRGKITRQGSGQRRVWLVGAAWQIWRRQGVVGSELRYRAERIATRSGKRVAVVVLARRRAEMLYALWRDGSVYDEACVGQRQHAAALRASGPRRRDAQEPRVAAWLESPGAVRGYPETTLGKTVYLFDS
jgi:transposase